MPDPRISNIPEFTGLDPNHPNKTHPTCPGDAAMIADHTATAHRLGTTPATELHSGSCCEAWARANPDTAPVTMTDTKSPVPPVIRYTPPTPTQPEG